MIAGLTPYPEYKDSGFSWIGSVPRHWSILPNRAIFAEVKDRNHPDAEMLSVTINRGIVRQKALLLDSSKKDSSRQDKTAYKLVQPFDIAYNKMRAWQGAIGVSELHGIISPAYVVMRLRDEQNARYFHYLYRTPYFAKEAEHWSYGITSDMWSLRPEHFKMIYSARPPRDEQDSIVRFLDYTNGRIDRTIRAKKRMIALLTEQKQAIIHRTVIKGLDPKVPLKPSGIPWLGDIPGHWNVKKLKFEMSFCGGGTPSKANSRYWKGSIPWVSPKDMKTDIITDTEDHITEQAIAQSSTKLVEPGSILMVVRSGILQRTIPIAVCDQSVALNQDMKALITNGILNPLYFIMIVRGCERALLYEWRKQGATVESIEHKFLANTMVPLPPAVEQIAIVQYLQEATAKHNQAIVHARREVELLKEYRTRLGNDVVTGKLDVRAAASNLPEMADESEALATDAEIDGGTLAADELEVEDE